MNVAVHLLDRDNRNPKSGGEVSLAYIDRRDRKFTPLSQLEIGGVVDGNAVLSADRSAGPHAVLNVASFMLTGKSSNRHTSP
jgi:hypothetical protein